MLSDLGGMGHHYINLERLLDRGALDPLAPEVLLYEPQKNGRMQLVDVTAGPIDRSLGLTTVKLHTAAATTDAAIPGLPPEEAGALRDRLAARGEEHSAGL